MCVPYADWDSAPSSPPLRMYIVAHNKGYVVTASFPPFLFSQDFPLSRTQAKAARPTRMHVHAASSRAKTGPSTAAANHGDSTYLSPYERDYGRDRTRTERIERRATRSNGGSLVPVVSFRRHHSPSRLSRKQESKPERKEGLR